MSLPGSVQRPGFAMPAQTCVELLALIPSSLSDAKIPCDEAPHPPNPDYPGGHVTTGGGFS